MDENTPADPQQFAAEPAQTPEIAGHGDDQPLTELHPNYKSALRVQAIITSIPFIVAAFILEGQAILPTATIMVPVVLIALAFIIRLPARRVLQ